MAVGRFEFRNIHRVAGALALSLALVCGLTPAQAAGAKSSPADRARFVAVTHRLEQAPLDPALEPDSRWALQWITEAPDISVSLCLEMIGVGPDEDYRYGPELLRQYAFSMGAALIEHPEIAGDEQAQQMAGVEGSLTAYRAIIAAKPEARWPQLDSLFAAQAKGELPDLVRKTWAGCKES